jgi:hypothetical protein
MKTIQEKAEERLQKEREERAIKLAMDIKKKINKHEKKIKKLREELEEEIEDENAIIAAYKEQLQKLDDSNIEQIKHDVALLEDPYADCDIYVENPAYPDGSIPRRLWVEPGIR